jgi:hypothetical protein
VSTKGPTREVPSTFKLNLASEDCAVADSTRSFRMHVNWRNGDKMGVLAFVVLTVAVFAVLGLVQKLVERL